MRTKMHSPSNCNLIVANKSRDTNLANDSEHFSLADLQEDLLKSTARFNTAGGLVQSHDFNGRRLHSRKTSVGQNIAVA